MFHVKRTVTHTYTKAQIDYGIIALSIYKKLKEEKKHENEADASKDSQLHGMQGA